MSSHRPRCVTHLHETWHCRDFIRLSALQLCISFVTVGSEVAGVVKSDLLSRAFFDLYIGRSPFDANAKASVASGVANILAAWITRKRHTIYVVHVILLGPLAALHTFVACLLKCVKWLECPDATIIKCIFSQNALRKMFVSSSLLWSTPLNSRKSSVSSQISSHVWSLLCSLALCRWNIVKKYSCTTQLSTQIAC